MEVGKMVYNYISRLNERYKGISWIFIFKKVLKKFEFNFIFNFEFKIYYKKIHLKFFKKKYEFFDNK